VWVGAPVLAWAAPVAGLPERAGSVLDHGRNALALAQRGVRLRRSNAFYTC
jgi:hypothetical protein